MSSPRDFAPFSDRPVRASVRIFFRINQIRVSVAEASRLARPEEFDHLTLLNQRRIDENGTANLRNARRQNPFSIKQGILVR
jgi:hypothetical protein